RVALVLSSESVWLRGLDLNQRPFGYEGNFGGDSPPLSTTKYLKSRPDADTVLALICGGSRTKHGQNADTIALPIEPHPALTLDPFECCWSAPEEGVQTGPSRLNSSAAGRASRQGAALRWRTAAEPLVEERGSRRSGYRD